MVVAVGVVLVVGMAAAMIAVIVIIVIVVTGAEVVVEIAIAIAQSIFYLAMKIYHFVPSCHLFCIPCIPFFNVASSMFRIYTCLRARTEMKALHAFSKKPEAEH